jgi:hypothetical protein
MSLSDNIAAGAEQLSRKALLLASFVSARTMGVVHCAAGISPDLSGSWRKDRNASQADCYSRQLDLLQIQGIQKACAEKLINGLQIEQKDNGKGTTKLFLVFMKPILLPHSH